MWRQIFKWSSGKFDFAGLKVENGGSVECEVNAAKYICQLESYFRDRLYYYYYYPSKYDAQRTKQKIIELLFYVRVKYLLLIKTHQYKSIR